MSKIKVLLSLLNHIIFMEHLGYHQVVSTSNLLNFIIILFICIGFNLDIDLLNFSYFLCLTYFLLNSYLNIKKIT
jgi:hypothetical protein